MSYKIWKEIQISESTLQDTLKKIEEGPRSTLTHWLKKYDFLHPHEGTVKFIRIQLGELGIYTSTAWRDIFTKVIEKGLEQLSIADVPFLFANVMNDQLKESTHIMTNWELWYDGNPEWKAFLLEPDYNNKIHLRMEMTYRAGSSRPYNLRWGRSYGGPVPAKNLWINPDEYLVFIQV